MNINKCLTPEYPYSSISQNERKIRTCDLLESLDYKIIVSPDYYNNILVTNPYFWVFTHEGTLRGEPDKINGIDVYFNGVIIDENYKIGIYVFVDEWERYNAEELKKSNVFLEKERHKCIFENKEQKFLEKLNEK